MRTVFGVSRIFIGAFLVVASFLFAESAHGQTVTHVSGPLTEDAVWSGGIYVPNQVEIPAGVTLTIAPGTIIKVQRFTYPFLSSGKLVIGDEGGAPVIVTSYADDTVGGDTNLDENASHPADWGERWRSLVASSGTVDIANAEFRYGAGGEYATITNDGARVTVTGSMFKTARTHFILTGGETEIRESSITGADQFGIEQRNGRLIFGGNTFVDNREADVYRTGGSFVNEGGNSGPGRFDILNSLADDQVWPADGLTYVPRDVVIEAGTTLAIQPGAVVKLNGDTALKVHGTLRVGDPDATERVVFTSLTDDEYGGDTNRDEGASLPSANSASGIAVESGGALEMDHATVRYGGRSGFAQLMNNGEMVLSDVRLENGGHALMNESGGTLTLRDSVITGAIVGLEHRTGSVTLENNSIAHNQTGVISRFGHTVDATHTWWGDDSGPQHWALNPSGLGNPVSDNVLFIPWLTRDPQTACQVDCFSSVLFLPGIKGSRLYKDGSLGIEDKLWLPNYLGDDFRELELNEAGQSREDVYTRDVVEEALLPWVSGVNLYKSFLSQLENYKQANVINDYEAFAYDWRQSVEDIVRNGTPYPNGVSRSLVATLEQLANDSKSEKVTIVAHSNGGLLAKALMIELEQRGLAHKVDKIVMVGSPQMGTPLTMLSLLYGHEEALMRGLLYSEEAARSLARNMPSAYGLLPTEEYFRRAESFIEFKSERTRYAEFLEFYGSKINDYDEFRDFLLGEEGRDQPDHDEVELENKLNEQLLDKAVDMHRRLEAWAPPAEVELIQIAGWGLDTVSGVRYTDEAKRGCDFSLSLPACLLTGERGPVYEPTLTVDGDGVVVAPSALMLSEAENVKRYWVDLYRSNKIFTNGREHKDILEFSFTLNFLESIIKEEENISVPQFHYKNRPDDFEEAESRIRMSLYSPLDIHLYDSAGNHTGPKSITENGEETIVFEENIPNSYYYQFGEYKFVGFPGDENIRIEMDGTGEGSYRLKLEEVIVNESGEHVSAHTEFTGLPTTSETQVTLTVPETGLENLSSLAADLDGDGNTEYTVEPILNGTATLDVTAPTSDISVNGEIGNNNWYTTDVVIALGARDDTNGSGVAETRYSLDGEATWKVYAEPFTLSTEGIHEIQYYSVDQQGNSETIQQESIHIDTSAPEAKITFNATSQKLEIIGIDAIDQSIDVDIREKTKVVQGPSVFQKHPILWWLWQWIAPKKEKKTFLTATLSDDAGHETVLEFTKRKDLKYRIDLALNSIAYDGAKTDLSHSAIQYKWLRDKKGKYQLFASYLRTPEKKVESHYFSKKNQTVIMERPEELADDGDDDADRRPTRTRMSGMVIPNMMTNLSEINIDY